MRYLLQISFCLLSFQIAISQSTPTAITESFQIQDVIILGNETYYSSSTDILKISENNDKTIIDDRDYSFTCIGGKFYKEQDGWIYLGWNFYSIDYGVPILLIKQFDGEILTDHTIDLSEKINGTFRHATYQSMDSIFIISYQQSKFKFLTVNTNAEILNSVDLNLSTIKNMVLLEDDLNLIIGKNELNTFGNNSLMDQISFNLEIEDVQYYPNKRIEVLTKQNIYWLDNSLNILKTIPLAQNSRTPTALYSENDMTHLVEIENDISFISAIDSLGNISSEFIEIPAIEYSDILVTDNKFAIWGKTNCPLSNSILKLDIDGVDYEIPTINIGIDELIVNHDGITTDTVVDDGEIIIFSTTHFSWELTISNYGDETIEEYTVTSSQFDYGEPRFISFVESESIGAGESRVHSGNFSYVYFNTNPINFYTWVGSNILDEDCSNNRIYKSAITSTSELNTTEVSLYPNPAFQEIYIDLSKQFTYKIIDANGKLYQSEKHHSQKTINIEGLPSGMYFIQIELEDTKSTQKFVKY